MNRHHYAVFVHNCRLVFLLRKEAEQVTSLDKFMPAEWRWSIPHVCDSNWHHYAISVDYPKVRAEKTTTVFTYRCFRLHFHALSFSDV